MHTSSFNEQSWLKLVFLLADTQAWIDELSNQAFEQLPVHNKNKLFRSTYRLTPKAMAHILERHYYKIARHPVAGKFNIPLPVMLGYIRDAGAIEPLALSGTLNRQRVLHTDECVGINNEGREVCCLTVITGPGGDIITAFPGLPGQSTG